jgi:cell division protein FtsI/penicillin-binding protein 2
MNLRIRRHTVVFVLLGAALAGLGLRLGRAVYAYANPATPEFLARANYIEATQCGPKIILPLPAKPGDLYAKGRHNYILLAGSRQTPGCFVDPSLLDDEGLAAVCMKAAEWFGGDPSEYYAHICQRRGRKFAWLAREITPAQAEKVCAWKNRAVGIQYEWRREYPNGSLAGTLIGFRQKDGQPGSALEWAVREITQARPGQRVLFGDAGRRAIWSLREQTRQPLDGASVHLGLDLVIQASLQQAVARAVEKFDAEWGAGVVINPWTGDVLAMSSCPTFDPNHYNTATADQMLNRAICCPFEPGSVFKPIFAAAAVETGLASYQDKFFCENGVYHAHRGGRISDHGHHYGTLSLRDVVVHSSNIGMAKLGEKLGNPKQFEILHRWGFGEKTRLGLGGETGGIIRPLEKWDGYSLRRVPFGQEVSVSALQLAMAFGAIANGGELMRPRLVHVVSDANGRTLWRSRPESVRRVIRQDVAAQTLAVLRDVVERGSGKNCRLSRWSSWGKTGTAQIPGPGGYIDGAYVASFIGGAPIRKPAVVCLISIYRPDRKKGYYGGDVAAPYVKTVLEETLTYLHIAPDRP